MASYSIIPPLVQSELKMTLYNKEVYSGRETNGLTSLSTRGVLGTTWVFSWPVTDGPGGGNIVGHLQATGVQVAFSPNCMWHYNLGLVFGQNSRFNGSTLQIQGTSDINGEWSIVGGERNGATSCRGTRAKLHKMKAAEPNSTRSANIWATLFVCFLITQYALCIQE